MIIIILHITDMYQKKIIPTNIKSKISILTVDNFKF